MTPIVTNFQFKFDQYISWDTLDSIVKSFPAGDGIAPHGAVSIFDDSSGGYVVTVGFHIEDRSETGRNKAETKIRDYLYKNLMELPKTPVIGPDTTGSVIQDTIKDSIKSGNENIIQPVTDAVSAPLGLLSGTLQKLIIPVAFAAIVLGFVLIKKKGFI